MKVGAQFICGNPSRRLRILTPAFDGTLLNGIDYLEVVDHAAPPTYAPQTTLVVKLFQPVPAAFADDQVRVTGGVRFTNIGVVWAKRLVDMVLSPDEQAYFDPRFPTPSDRERVLVVRTDAWGDYSTYALSLQVSAVAPQEPPGFDPVLSTVEFSFKVECPTDYDCKPVDDCAPAVIAAPTIDYLAKDYASFRRVILDRLSSLSPEWTEREPADTGMVIAELLAYAGDQLSYYQDAVGTEAYLGTSRRRLSVRRHARLLDYHMHEGANARTFVCFEIEDEVGPAGVLLPRFNPDGSPTIVMTKVSEQVRLAPDPTVLMTLLATANPTVFEPMHDTMLYPQHNRIELYTWGDDDCCLPAGATAATVADSDPAIEPRLCLMPGDVLVFEEIVGHETGLGADTTRRQAVRLTKVTPSATLVADSLSRVPGPPAHDPLTGQRIVEIEWHVDDALQKPVCITAAAQVQKPISVARGNAVLVDHGRTIVEALSPATFTEPKRYRPVLRKPEITHGVPVLEPTTPELPVTKLLAQDPHAAVPHVGLAKPGEEWSAVQDLLGAERFDPSFVVEIDEGGYATLRFGDGVLGREPEPDLVATYRVGRGPGGNVGPETLVQVMTSATGITAVRNPLAAVGGLAPESLDDVKHYAPEAFRIQERAVTEADYAACALRHPEVRRAVATRRWTGSWHTVFLTIERAFGKPLDDEFKGEITDFLETYRLTGEDLEIEAPIFVPLAVSLVVCCKPEYFRDQVHQALKRAFAAYFARDEFAFGEKVYLSQLVSTAMSVPGIDWVNPADPRFVFRRAYDAPSDEIAKGYIPMGRLEIAQCESSPNDPEHGRIDFIVEGGQ